MNLEEYLDHLALEFKRLSVRTTNEAELMTLLNSFLRDAYTQGVRDELARNVATDCFGG